MTFLATQSKQESAWHFLVKGEVGFCICIEFQKMIISSSQVLDSSVKLLKDALAKRPEGDHLVWDKDDDPALDFVVACANIRATIFNIPNKSRFDVKSMAGNVIQYL